MKFSYYLYPPSYEDSTINIIEKNLKTLNCLLINHADDFDSFFYDKSLLGLKFKNGLSFCDIIYGKLSDKQFMQQILPKMLMKLNYCKHAYTKKSDLDTIFSESENAFWGIRFSSTELYNIKCIEDYSKFRYKTIRDAINNINFKTLKDVLFKKIVFCDDVPNMLNSIGKKEFEQMIERLIALDNYNIGWTNSNFNLKEINEKTSLTVSDESDTVKNDNKLKSYRYFTLPNNLGGKYCYYHIKTGDFRLHFYPDVSSHKIYVAYIGTHLPLR